MTPGLIFSPLFVTIGETPGYFMRQLMLLTCLLSILPVSMTLAVAAQTVPAARTVQVQPLTVTQRQFARQFGQRLARDPSYKNIDADWRQFVRSQPKGMNLPNLLALIRQEAINAKNREVRQLRRHLEESRRRKALLGHELTHVRQQRASAARRNKVADLENRKRGIDELSRLQRLKLEEHMQKQSRMQQQLSSALGNMSTTAQSIIQNQK